MVTKVSLMNDGIRPINNVVDHPKLYLIIVRSEPGTCIRL